MELAEQFKLSNDQRLPVRLGSALKVPSYAYPDWGIDDSEEELREESDRGYEVEWLGLDGKGGSPRQMEYVIEALKSSKLDNYSQMLRDKGAEIVSYLVREVFEGRGVHYLEVGAGVSTEFVIKRLKADGVDLDRVFMTLVEPGARRIEGTASRLESEYGLKRNKNFRVVNGTDMDIPEHVEPNSQDIALAVATFHHHAFLDKPTKAIADCLAYGGRFITADWHNSMWEHPNRVYSYLEKEFDWPTKEEDLAEFARRFPKALEQAPEDPLNEASNADIRKFWKGWEKVRREAIESGTFNLNDDIMMLEGHRPVEKYVKAFKGAGLFVDKEIGMEKAGILSGNPHKVLNTDSRILMVTTGTKRCKLY